IITARMSEAELTKWFPVRFDEINDPLAAAEPSKGALVQLKSGTYVVLFYGKESKQLIVEMPEPTKDPSSFLDAFFKEVPVPRSRVLWHRAGVKVPKQGSSRSNASVTPKKRVIAGAGKAARAKRSA